MTVRCRPVFNRLIRLLRRTRATDRPRDCVSVPALSAPTSPTENAMRMTRRPSAAAAAAAAVAAVAFAAAAASASVVVVVTL